MDNENKDIYRADLLLLKKRTVAWTEAHAKWKAYQRNILLACVIGFGFIIFMLIRVTGKTGMMNQLPLHISIWVTAIAIYLVARYAYNTCKPPFKSFANARFEMGDHGISYIYQRKMREYMYFIADEDIKEMIYDEEVFVLYIKGKARLDCLDRKRGKTTQELDEFYAIIAFDEYDVDDLLEPYSDIVKRESGTLRARFVESGVDKMPDYR